MRDLSQTMREVCFARHVVLAVFRPALLPLSASHAQPARFLRLKAAPPARSVARGVSLTLRGTRSAQPALPEPMQTPLVAQPYRHAKDAQLEHTRRPMVGTACRNVSPAMPDHIQSKMAAWHALPATGESIQSLLVPTPLNLAKRVLWGRTRIRAAAHHVKHVLAACSPWMYWPPRLSHADSVLLVLTHRDWGVPRAWRARKVPMHLTRDQQLAWSAPEVQPRIEDG